MPCAGASWSHPDRDVVVGIDAVLARPTRGDPIRPGDGRPLVRERTVGGNGERVGLARRSAGDGAPIGDDVVALDDALGMAPLRVGDLLLAVVELRADKPDLQLPVLVVTGLHR